eukprot:1950820-Prymnesium_polylepis.1
MWVPDLGLSLRVRPGMTVSSGAISRPPGFLPAPCGGHGPPQRPPPGGHSPASHAGDAPCGTQPGAEHVLCDGVQCG